MTSWTTGAALPGTAQRQWAPFSSSWDPALEYQGLNQNPPCRPKLATTQGPGRAPLGGCKWIIKSKGF